MFEVFVDIISEMAVSMLKLYLNQFSIDLIFFKIMKVGISPTFFPNITLNELS